jgi:hypothetical protein
MTGQLTNQQSADLLSWRLLGGCFSELATPMRARPGQISLGHFHVPGIVRCGSFLLDTPVVPVKSGSGTIVEKERGQT